MPFNERRCPVASALTPLENSPRLHTGGVAGVAFAAADVANVKPVRWPPAIAAQLVATTNASQDLAPTAARRRRWRSTVPKAFDCANKNAIGGRQRLALGGSIIDGGVVPSRTKQNNLCKIYCSLARAPAAMRVASAATTVVRADGGAGPDRSARANFKVGTHQVSDKFNTAR